MLTVTEQRRPPTLFNSVGTVTPAPTQNSGGNSGKPARVITRLLGAYDDPVASVHHGRQNAESGTFCDTTTNVVDALGEHLAARAECPTGHPGPLQPAR